MHAQKVPRSEALTLTSRSEALPRSEPLTLTSLLDAHLTYFLCCVLLAHLIVLTLIALSALPPHLTVSARADAL